MRLWEKLLLEFHAAFAPAVPHWYKDQPFPEVKAPRHWESLPEEDPDKKTLAAWHRDPNFILPARLGWYKNTWTRYYEDKRNMERLNEQCRYYSWRYHYAQRMIIERRSYVRSARKAN